jgi:hypothetical protein
MEANLPVMLCPHCDATDRPTLRPGPTPHAAYATCARCGEHNKLISLSLLRQDVAIEGERARAD